MMPIITIITVLFLLIALLMIVYTFWPTWNFGTGPVLSIPRIIGLIIGLILLYVAYLIVVWIVGALPGPAVH